MTPNSFLNQIMIMVILHSYVTYPRRIDLSMHSLQKRCKHSITVLVFLMIPAKVISFYQIDTYHGVEKQAQKPLSRTSAAGVPISLGLLHTKKNGKKCIPQFSI